MSTKRIIVPLDFSFAAVATGIAKKKGKLDLGVIYCHNPCVATAVFTTNQVKAAPVLFSRRNVKKGRIQAVVANSGNANACTGEKGWQNCVESASLLARLLKISPEKVIVASTGVIGVPLPMDKVRSGIQNAARNLRPSVSGARDLAAFSQAIMTTDTKSKIVSAQFPLDGEKVTITGVAKGAGMIHPNMATMLTFILTDASIGHSSLSYCLKNSVNKSFNMLTVDGDTSTNDMVLVLASGQAKNKIEERREGLVKFQGSLDLVCLELAKMIARDGEGATKLVEVEVSGAKNFVLAKQVAMAVAKSSLVKTAIFGNDPNWGRIMAAIGYSGAKIEPTKIDIAVGHKNKQIQLCVNGQDPGFKEQKAIQILKNKELKIKVNLKQGKAQATVFTCDLTPGYIDINASYRT